MSPGRPSLYTKDVSNEIADRLSQGEPLAVICRDDHMPSDRTVRDWMASDPEFSAVIARAREIGFDVIAADCLHIADQPNKRITPEGEAHESDPARDRLRVETRLKLLAKWDPRRYGEKQQVEHSGQVTLESLIGESAKDEGS